MSTTTKNRRPRLSVRLGLGLAAVAGVASTLGGFGLHAAQAEVNDPFGTVDLMQGSDIGSVKENVGELNLQQTDLYGARSLSRCTGKTGADTITGDKDLNTLGSRWTNQEGEIPGKVTEAIAEARTAKAAKHDALAVVSALRRCQTEPAGHWRYGQLYNGPLENGSHVWMDYIDGHGRTTGGVAVLLQGRRFAVVEVSSSIGDGDDAIKNTMLPAEDRLAA